MYKMYMYMYIHVMGNRTLYMTATFAIYKQEPTQVLHQQGQHTQILTAATYLGRLWSVLVSNSLQPMWMVVRCGHL